MLILTTVHSDGLQVQGQGSSRMSEDEVAKEMLEGGGEEEPVLDWSHEVHTHSTQPIARPPRQLLIRI